MSREEKKIVIVVIVSLLLIALCLIWISTIPEGTNGILTATKTDATDTDATETDAKVTYIERYNLEPMTWNEVEEEEVYIPSPVLSERKEPEIEVEIVTTETITEETTEGITEEVYEEPVEEPIQESTGMSYLGTYYITGYVATGNPCSNGNYPTAGYTVASNTIPMGTTIWIDGLGTRVVEDTGGMAGNVIDVFVGSVDEAYAITGNYEVYIYE